MPPGGVWAPIAQGIEQRPPEPCAQVRILLGALAKGISDRRIGMPTEAIGICEPTLTESVRGRAVCVTIGRRCCSGWPRSACGFGGGFRVAEPDLGRVAVRAGSTSRPVLPNG